MQVVLPHSRNSFRFRHNGSFDGRFVCLWDYEKESKSLQLGYVLAGAAGTLPVAYDLWLNGGKKYGGLTNQGLFLTYTSLVAPPQSGCLLARSLKPRPCPAQPKPSSRKKSWYQGRFARTDEAKGDHKSKKDQEQKKGRQDKQNRRERYTKGGKNKKRPQQES